MNLSLKSKVDPRAERVKSPVMMTGLEVEIIGNLITPIVGGSVTIHFHECRNHGNISYQLST